MTTKLEKTRPHLTEIARAVDPGRSIHYRSGAYWLGDVQLTYDRRGDRVPDWLGQVELAEEIMRGILRARDEDPCWGDIWQRQRRVLVGLHDETLPRFRHGYFCYWRHPTLDDGRLSASPFGRCAASVCLAARPDNEAHFEAESTSLVGAIDALWMKLTPGERPPW
jgi:hypothetical protein